MKLRELLESKLSRFELYTVPEDHQNRYSYLEPARGREPNAVSLDCLSRSDYSGTALEVSNIEQAEEEFPEESFAKFYGSAGTEALAFWLDNEESAEEIASFLFGLLDYPIGDESRLSEVEHRLESEAWERYGAKEFREALQDGIDKPEDLLTVAADNAKLREVFSLAAGIGNVNGGPGYEFETGASVYYYSERVAEALGNAKLAALGVFGLTADSIVQALADESPEDWPGKARFARWILGLGAAIRDLAKKLGTELSSWEFLRNLELENLDYTAGELSPGEHERLVSATFKGESFKLNPAKGIA